MHGYERTNTKKRGNKNFVRYDWCDSDRQSDEKRGKGTIWYERLYENLLKVVKTIEVLQDLDVISAYFKRKNAWLLFN